MMKFIFIFSLLLCSIFSYSQYPNGTQFLGTDSNVVRARGGFQGRFININYADTTAANLDRIRQYPGAQIYTSSDNLIWYRNAAATAWVQVAFGSGANIYNSDGILLAHRILTGNNNTYSLTLDSLSGFTVKANVGVQYSRLDLSTFVTGISYIGQPNTSSVSVANGNVSMGIVSGNGIDISTDSIRKAGPGIGLSNDTTNRKIQTINPITGAESYSNWIGSTSAAGNSHNVQLNRNGSFYGSDSLLYNSLGLVNLGDYTGRSLKLSNSTSSIGALYMGGDRYLTNYGPFSDNIAFGKAAGSTSSVLTNRRNISIGRNAGLVNQSSANIFIGDRAGESFTGAADTSNEIDNVFIGSSAGVNATGTRNSIFIGPRAGEDVTTGSYSNTAIGKYILEKCTTCAANSMYGASINLIDGINNSVIGADILVAGTSASHNSLSGMFSYSNTTTGSYNVGSGYFAAYNNTTGSHNVTLGDHSLYTNVTGSNNIALGDYALAFNTTDSYMFSVHSGNGGTFGKALIGGDLQNANACIGCREDSIKLGGAKLAVIGNLRVTHQDSTSSPQNMAYVDQEGYLKIAAVPGGISSLTVGTTPITSGTDTRLFYQASGVLSQSANLTFASNILTINGVNIGRGTAGEITNTAIGNGAGNAWTTATNSAAFGYQSLNVATSAPGSAAFGYRSLASNTTGNYNHAFGLQALELNVSGNYNSAFGAQALKANTSNGNAAFGFQSMLVNNSGNSNSAFGYSSLAANTTGVGSVAVGYNAGIDNTTGLDNTYVGYGARGPSTGSHNLILGSLLNIGNVSDNIALGTNGNVRAQFNGTNWTFTGAVTLTNGSLTLGTAGNKINITTGSNASAGLSGAMTAGTITISTTSVTANSIVILTPVGAGSGSISLGTVTAGTSFVINSSDGADTRTVQWLIIN